MLLSDGDLTKELANGSLVLDPWDPAMLRIPQSILQPETGSSFPRGPRPECASTSLHRAMTQKEVRPQ